MISKSKLLFVVCAVGLSISVSPALACESEAQGNASVRVLVTSPALAKLVKNVQKLKQQSKPAVVGLGAFTAGALVYTTWHLNSFLSKQVGWLAKTCVYRPCAWLKGKIWGNGAQADGQQGENKHEKIVGKIAEWGSFIGLWLLQVYMLKNQYTQAMDTLYDIADNLSELGLRDVSVNA